MNRFSKLIPPNWKKRAQAAWRRAYGGLLLACFFSGVQVHASDQALIPGGAFLMGSKDGAPDEHPVHKVCVDPFYMDRYLVTNADFARFSTSLGISRRRAKGAGQRGAPFFRLMQNPEERRPLRPQEGIRESSRDKGVLVRGQGICAMARKRLPTEAEWERAARVI